MDYKTTNIGDVLYCKHSTHSFKIIIITNKTEKITTYNSYIIGGIINDRQISYYSGKETRSNNDYYNTLEEEGLTKNNLHTIIKYLFKFKFVDCND
jgi:hypothetical protein